LLMERFGAIGQMAHTRHNRWLFVASGLLVALCFPKCADAKVRAERRQLSQQADGLDHLRAEDAVKTSVLLDAGKSTFHSANVSFFSRSLGAIASWALPLRGALVGRAATLVQTDRELPGGIDATLDDTVETPHSVNVYQMLFTALIWGCLATGAAYYFRTHPEVVVHKPSDGSPVELSRFTSDAFDADACLNDCGICAWAICCPCVLWAGTVDRLGLLGYWTAFAIFASLWILHHAVAVFFCWWALAVLLAYNRHRIRQAFGIQVQWVVATFTSDCLCFCLGCLPCLISQEARHVKRAAALGHSAVAGSSNAGNV
jgi:Cys-rich protein (TIGR01571 family)